LTYKGTTYDIAAGGTDKKYIYWDSAYTTMFRDTNNLQDVFDAEGWLMCINDEGTAYPAYSLRTIHGAVIQAGTLIVGTADIEDAAITTAKIKDLAVETAKVKDNAITFPVSAYTESGWEKGDIQTVSITTTGGPVVIIGSVRVKAAGTAEVLHRDYVVSLKRDTNEIYTSGTLYVFCWGEGTTGYTLTTVCYKETPSAGTYTYKLNLASDFGTGAQRFLYAMETKK